MNLFGKGKESTDEEKDLLEVPPELNFDLDSEDDSFIIGSATPKQETEGSVKQPSVPDNKETEEQPSSDNTASLPEDYNELVRIAEEEGIDIDGVIPEELAEFIEEALNEKYHPKLEESYQQEPNYHMTPEEQQELEFQVSKAKAKKRLTNLITGFTVTALLIASILVYNFTDIFKDNADDSYPMYETQLNELITLMYDAQGVDELAKANPAILNYFDPTIQPANDIRDSNVYAERYGYFHNMPMKVKVNEFKQLESSIFIRYTIECEVASPLTRIALVDINNEGKIVRFTEYNTY